MSETTLHNPNPNPLDPTQLDRLKKIYALLAEAGTLADKLDEGLHTRLEELVKTVEEDYARLTDVVAVVRWPLKQVLQEQIGEEETENLIAGDGGYRVLLLAEAEAGSEAGSEGAGEGAATGQPIQSHRKVVLLTPGQDIYSQETIPVGTVGEFILTQAYGGDWTVEFRNGPDGQGDLTAVITSQTCNLNDLLPLEFNYEIPEAGYDEDEEAEEAEGGDTQ